MSFSQSVPLVNLRKGDRGVILALPEHSELRSQCIRLGICLGAHLQCSQRLPGGTIVIEIGRQEIAIGKALAEGIEVSMEEGEAANR
ncbi:MAG: ferrous iron transport protein A [Chlorobi bacterium]|nr:ferrous iron transport protein A [Chlorobiota bacterium]MBX7217247.1 ferrous iron transport protein A [Candidatus Kapabacteria bacterium]